MVLNLVCSPMYPIHRVLIQVFDSGLHQSFSKPKRTTVQVPDIRWRTPWTATQSESSYHLNNPAKLIYISSIVVWRTFTNSKTYSSPYFYWNPYRRAVSPDIRLHLTLVCNGFPRLLSEGHDGELLALTIHVLFSCPQRLASAMFPYPMRPIPSPPNGDEASTLQLAEGNSPIERVRSALIDWLATEALGGDKFAAEWVLLCMISRT